ncbi:excalibur calcium-binding domain-containing protein [Kineosporia rhizophila]|uniref:excalibur calcium-binding domain-containing protein n=1 Tax=Kineosporia TaxID=49184 RepID=UPI001E306995|nr:MULTISPECIES: excalibur calcium-binding domain-containing protein [Kineosporia]MCE0537376.1 excalibur calcium-binding domain-containing protein [Kineosporia rhizophila]GLY17477.1 hypothetical protein Kisp01_44910 [Kineosporia sp. NBRC 101677]
MVDGWSFNPPPHWPRPPRGWVPPPDWEPDPEWGPLPPGWQLWVPTPSTRHPWPAVLCAAGVVALAVGAISWVPRMSDAALLPGDSQLRPAGLGSGAPVVEGTRTPEIPGPRTVQKEKYAPPVEATQMTQETAPRFKNCDRLVAEYPHGVGLPEAVDVPAPRRDERRSGAEDGPGLSSPVVDFGRSTALYGANQGLDLDQDGIACERA